MSNITTVGFDAAFPVAGQDNDSQGFRTNFNVTKVALEAAADEITALETNTAKLNVDNVFNGSKISEAELLANTETLYPHGPVTGNKPIDFTDGHYQTLTVGADVTLTLTGWPDSDTTMSRIRLVIVNDGTNRTITWAGFSSLKTNGAWRTTTATSNYTVIDFWTTNGGTLVYGLDHGTFN